MPNSIGKDLEVVLANKYGEPVATIGDELVSLQYGRTLGFVGSATVSFPRDAFDPSLVQVDGRIEFWRSVGGNPRTLDTETSFLIRKIRRRRDPATGRELMEINGPSAVDLLRRRIVAYPAGDPLADVSGAADDVMKLIVAYNLGISATDPFRNFGAYFDSGTFSTAGPTIRKAFSRRNVLEVLREISDATLSIGPAVFFDVIRRSNAAFEFRTYIGQRGTDHGTGSETPVVFSTANGNLTDEEQEDDYTEETTYAYAGGQGEEEARAVGVAGDSIRYNRSPFGRIETWIDARDTTDSTALGTEALAAVNGGRPKRKVLGTLLSTPETLYGRDWRFGDRVKVRVFENEQDVLINSLAVSVPPSGEEKIECRVEGADLV